MFSRETEPSECMSIQKEIYYKEISPEIVEAGKSKPTG
jgi:hypothetical protein